MSDKNNGKKNGSSNGKWGGGDDDGKIVSLPLGKEREKIKKSEEKRIREDYKARQKAAKKAAHQPFFKFGNIPPFTKIMVSALIAIHLVLYLVLDSNARLAAIYNFGFIPSNLTDFSEFKALTLMTPLTHVFIHGGWFHLLLNAAMGGALGIFFERAYGTRTTVIFFFACALGGIALFTVIAPFSSLPLIGASGGINGLFGAFLYLTMRQLARPSGYNVYSTREIVGGQHALKQKAQKLVKDKGPWPILIFWGLLICLFDLIGGRAASFSAHLGGYATGILISHLIYKGKIRL